MKAIIYTQLDEKLKQNWLSLWNNSPFANYANSPHWLMSVMEAFNYKNPVIIAIYEDENLMGVAPLIKKTKYGVKFYTVPPEDFVCGFPFLLDTQNKTSLKILLSEFLRLGNVFLDNIPEQLIIDLKQQTKEIKAITSSLNFYLNINKDVNGNVIVRNKKRLMRRAQEIEEKLHLKCYNGSSTDALGIAFTIDNKSRKQEKGYNAFSDELTKIFYNSLAKYFKENFLVIILYFEKKPIAFEIGFIVGKTFYASQIASAKEYDIYSISRALLIKLIEDLGSKGTEKIDFGSGDDHVKRSLTKDYGLLYSVIVSKNPFIRSYLSSILYSRTKIYNYLQQHMKLYAAYRRLKNLENPL